MYGQYDYNKLLPAPMGCAAMVYNKPDTRQTWDDHAINGYYFETLREHYQCYKIWIKETRSIQVADTVHIKYLYIIMLTYTRWMP